MLKTRSPTFIFKKTNSRRELQIQNSFQDLLAYLHKIWTLINSQSEKFEIFAQKSRNKAPKQK